MITTDIEWALFTHQGVLLRGLRLDQVDEATALFPMYPADIVAEPICTCDPRCECPEGSCDCEEF